MKKTVTMRARELSGLLGVSEKTLSQWVSAARIVRLRHGVYDLKESFRAFARHARTRQVTDDDIEQIRRDLEWAAQHPGPRLEPGMVVELTEIDLDGRQLAPPRLVTIGSDDPL
jgi:hypothetical protein